MKKITKLFLIGGASLLAISLAANSYLLSLFKKQSATPTNTKPAIESQIPVETQENTPEIEIYDENVLDDVFDEAKVEVAASKFLKSVNDSIGADHDYTLEEIEEWIRVYHAANKTEVTYDEVSLMKDRMIHLMQISNVDLINQMMDEKYPLKSTVIDWSLIIPVSNVKAYKLICELGELDKKLSNSSTKEEALQYAQKITNLIGNSWYLGGDKGKVPVAKLENSGDEVIIMTYMIFMAVKADAVQAMYFQRPDYICNGTIISLNEMMQEIHKVNCDENELNEYSAALLGIIEELNQTLALSGNRSMVLGLSKKGAPQVLTIEEV